MIYNDLVTLFKSNSKLSENKKVTTSLFCHDSNLPAKKPSNHFKSMAAPQRPHRCFNRISDETRQEIDALLMSNVDRNIILEKFGLSERKLTDIINDFKNKRTTKMTKEQEFKLIDLYKKGYTTVRLLRPFFPNAVGHAIRNKILMFKRWGVLEEKEKKKTSEVIDEHQNLIVEITKNDQLIFSEFLSDQETLDKIIANQLL